MDINIEWIKIVASILGGGAAGAIITAIVTNSRNRIQPVETTVDIEPVFVPSNILKDHFTQITFSSPSESFNFDNLYLIQIELLNDGNKDYKTFDFGLTFPEFVSIINVRTKGQDRHYNINLKQNVDFNSPFSMIDFEIQPFNRKDKYSISLYVTCSLNKSPVEPEFSSDMPVKFNKIEKITASTLLRLVILESISDFTSILYKSKLR